METKFKPGDRITVRTGEPRGHCRTPYYLRGKRGVIDEMAGRFRNPETLAYHKPGLPMHALYRVRFRQSDIWPDYTGAARDTLLADIYEHWLDADGGS